MKSIGDFNWFYIFISDRSMQLFQVKIFSDRSRSRTQSNDPVPSDQLGTTKTTTGLSARSIYIPAVCVYVKTKSEFISIAYLDIIIYPLSVKLICYFAHLIFRTFSRHIQISYSSFTHIQTRYNLHWRGKITIHSYVRRNDHWDSTYTGKLPSCTFHVLRPD